MKLDITRFVKKQVEETGEIELSSTELETICGGCGPESNGFPYQGGPDYYGGGFPYQQGFGPNYGGGFPYQQGFGSNCGGGFPYQQGFGPNYGGGFPYGYGDGSCQ
jgi:hypothetical protein